MSKPVQGKRGPGAPRPPQRKGDGHRGRPHGTPGAAAKRVPAAPRPAGDSPLGGQAADQAGGGPGDRLPRKAAPADRSDLIWGIHPVLELLSTSPEQVLELRILKAGSPAKLAPLLALAETAGIPCRTVDEPYPGTPAAANLQGVQARIRPVATIDLAELLARCRNSARPPLLLALDSIQDPHNLGALIRSASAAGASGILFPKDRSAPLSGTVAKVSAGAIAHLPLCQVTNLNAALQEIKGHGFWIYGAAADADTDIYRAGFQGPVCLVIGGEQSGIRPLVKRQCDVLVSIPMHSRLDSLNAAVAGAIIMFEIVRQQGTQAPR